MYHIHQVARLILQQTYEAERSNGRLTTQNPTDCSAIKALRSCIVVTGVIKLRSVAVASLARTGLASVSGIRTAVVEGKGRSEDRKA